MNWGIFFDTLTLKKMLHIPFPQAITEFAPSTGYSAPVIHEGFERVWRQFDRTHFEKLITEEAPILLERGSLDTWLDAHLSLDARLNLFPECGTHSLLLITASTVPSAAFQDLFISLILPIKVTLRPAHNLIPMMQMLVDHLTTYAPEMGTRVSLCDTGHDDDALRRIIQSHDTLNISGSDESIQHIQTLASEMPQKWIRHGHRVSAAALFRGETQTLDDSTLLKLAEDLSIWDQTGCLSPKIIFIEENFDTAKKFAKQLILKLDQVAKKLPETTPDLTELAVKNSRLRMTAFDGANIFRAQANHDVLVVYPPGSPIVPILHPRTTCIFCVQNAIKAASIFAGKGQAFGTQKPLNDAQTAELSCFGFNYFCTFGAMQDPPLYWKHDNIGTLLPLIQPI